MISHWDQSLTIVGASHGTCWASAGTFLWHLAAWYSHVLAECKKEWATKMSVLMRAKLSKRSGLLFMLKFLDTASNSYCMRAFIFLLTSKSLILLLAIANVHDLQKECPVARQISLLSQLRSPILSMHTMCSNDSRSILYSKGTGSGSGKLTWVWNTGMGMAMLS